MNDIRKQNGHPSPKPTGPGMTAGKAGMGKHASDANATDGLPNVNMGIGGSGKDKGRPNAGTLIGRRGFLYGAAGVGALAVVGIGATVANSLPGTQDTGVEHLDVPENALTSLAELQDLENALDVVQLVKTFELPYGTLVWVNDDNIAACLLPTESGSPLAMVGLLNLGSGVLSTILKQALGTSEHYEIYDVRATSSGVIWTEANALAGTWRVYSAKLSEGALGEALLMEEGDEAYETPALAVVNDRAFWQIQPKLPNDDGLSARLMCAPFGTKQTTCVFESQRRMGTSPYSATDSVVIAPRVDSSSVYYQLTNIDAKSGKVTDQLTLPHAMTPLEAGYGTNGFMFSFPDIYDYGGAIANLGTYTPLTTPKNGDYNGAKWFGFARTPTAPPAWCQNLLIVKSSYSVCGVDLAAGTYFAIDVDDGADTYGDYLATTGVRDTFVTFANIDHTPVEGKSTHACRVKIWRVLSESERTQRGQESGSSENADGVEGAEDGYDLDDAGVDDAASAGEDYAEETADEAIQA